MAAVALSFPSHRFDRLHHSITSQTPPLVMDPSEASVQLVPNPDFVFPARPSHATNTPSPAKRPVSMQLNLSPPSRQRSHQRQSVSTLPTFTFNATDTSGFGQSASPLPSPSSTIPTTPSRNMGHRRRASEFVGGDSRFGVSTLVSTSPSKPSESLLNPSESLSLPSESFPLHTDMATTTGSPSRRRGHAHRRSTAISGHDLASILQPRDVNVTSPAPVTELAPKEPARTPSPRGLSKEFLPEDVIFASGPTTRSSHSTPTRPSTAHPSTRPRVGFSENVEYIPRPLSTISAETTSSASTIHGHSVTNSISSVISLGGVGVPSPRRSFTPPTMDLRSGGRSAHRSSFDSRPFVETRMDDGANQDKQSFPESLQNTPNPSIKFDSPDGTPLPSKQKGHQTTLDRRRSEPLIFTSALEQPGQSTVSLHEPVMSGPFQDGQVAGCDLTRKSSRKKVKDWANAVLGRKTKDPRKTRSVTLDTSPQLPSEPNTPTTTQPDTPSTMPEVYLDAEPDLDAVFGQDPFSPVGDVSGFSFPQVQQKSDLETTYPSFSNLEENEDSGHVIDLDAALGPYGTPSMSGGRRQMHSGGFGKRGSDRGHNRSCSLPALTPFKFDRPSSPARPSMADVFEEEEDDEVASAEKTTLDEFPRSEDAESDDEMGTGIEVVDAVAEHEEQKLGRNADYGFGVQGHAMTNRSLGVSLSGSPAELRRTSVVEDTIVEEAVDIVGDYEEPRTSSVTKSSESSEASTVMAEQCGLGLSVPIAEQALSSPPTSYSTPTFSTPDYQQPQQFYDTSRLGTSASSIADNRTVSSCATGEHGVDMHMYVDDVPSLTSSRSTMISAMQQSAPRRDFSDSSDPSASVLSVPAQVEMTERRRKRSSIHSLSKLVGSSFGDGRIRASSDQRPQTAVGITSHEGKKRSENRLSKLMFWRTKSNSRSFSSTK